MTSSTNALPTRLFTNAFASMANVVISALLVFALYRLLLVRLGAETLGVWSLLIASVSAARLSEMGMAGAATRFVAAARARGDEAQAAMIVQTATITLLIFGLLGAWLAHLLLPSLLARVLHGSQLMAATQALPWALGAFALGLAASAVQSSLDGCQRLDLRVWIALAAQGVLLLVATALSRPYGLTGVAVAQGAQALVTLSGGWLVLRGQLRGLPVVPARWDLATFRHMLGYSALLQLNNLLLLLLDPLVKFLLTHFGGLSATAYFEMANQMVQRLRQLPIAAAQVLVPAMTQAGIEGMDRLKQLYGRGYRAIFAAAVPIFCFAAMLVPAISRLWIGHEEPLFERMAWICIAGWTLSTIGTPAYYGNVGIGTLASNSIGHALTSLCASLVGWLGGMQVGAVGVCAGYSLGVVAGGLYVHLVFMRRLGLPWQSLIPSESRGLLALSLIAVVLGLYLDAAMAHSSALPAGSSNRNWTHMGLQTALFLLVAGAGLWTHPLRRGIYGHIRQRVSRAPTLP